MALTLDRVPAPTVRCIAVSERTTDRIAGYTLGIAVYLAAMLATIGLLGAIFGWPL